MNVCNVVSPYSLIISDVISVLFDRFTGGNTHASDADFYQETAYKGLR